MAELPLSLLAHQYLTERATSKDLAVSTVRVVRSNLRSFCTQVGDVHPDELVEADVIRWLSRPTIGQGAARVGLSHLRTWFGWMIRRGHMSADPARDLRRREPRLAPRALPRAAVLRLLAAVPDVRGTLIVCLMVQEGLRCCEVSRAELGDVDLDDGVVLVRGKGGQERPLPLSEQTTVALRAYIGMSRGWSAGPLVRSENHPGMGISPEQVSKLVRQWLRQAGVEATPHQLRHTAATDMLRNGAHVRDVQRALGHASLATTQRYLPLMVEGLRQAMGGRWYGPEAA